MDNTKQEQLRKEALDATLERAGAFEVLVNQKGWEYLKAYIENQIRSFANKAILEGFKDMEDYQFERGMVTGLQRLIGEVDSNLNTLKNEREKTKGSTKQ